MGKLVNLHTTAPADCSGAIAEGIIHALGRTCQHKLTQNSSLSAHDLGFRDDGSDGSRHVLQLTGMCFQFIDIPTL